MANSRPSYNIVLVGKTGNGKSATGNSLLGREAFESKLLCSSVTVECQLESVVREDSQLHVLDTPGLFDTSCSQEEILEKLLDVMSLCPEGFDAFILVLNSAARFTDEEFKTFGLLKNFFGPDFLNVCIVVFTNGDNYEKNSKTSFHEWLVQESYENKQLKTLLGECGNRSILFYNKDENKKKDLAVKQLLRLICRIPSRYEHEHFLNAARMRQVLLMEERLPELQAEYQRKLSLINAELGEAEKNIKNLRDEDIMRVKTKIDDLLILIDNEDNGSGLLQNFKERVLQLSTMADGLHNKLKSKELLANLKEYTQLIKNPPKKRNIFQRFVCSFASKVILSIGSIVFPVLPILHAIPPSNKQLKYQERKQELERKIGMEGSAASGVISTMGSLEISGLFDIAQITRISAKVINSVDNKKK